MDYALAKNCKVEETICLVFTHDRFFTVINKKQRMYIPD